MVVEIGVVRHEGINKWVIFENKQPSDVLLQVKHLLYPAEKRVFFIVFGGHHRLKYSQFSSVLLSDRRHVTCRHTGAPKQTRLSAKHDVGRRTCHDQLLTFQTWCHWFSYFSFFWGPFLVLVIENCKSPLSETDNFSLCAAIRYLGLEGLIAQEAPWRHGDKTRGGCPFVHDGA